jgi:hypothetical protein
VVKNHLPSLFYSRYAKKLEAVPSAVSVAVLLVVLDYWPLTPRIF